MADATENPDQEGQKGVEPLSSQPATQPLDAGRRAVQRACLPLPDPYPDYVTCPHCGEPEVEVWCYMSGVRCHNCGEWIAHETPACKGKSPACCIALTQQPSQTEQLPPDAGAVE